MIEGSRDLDNFIPNWLASVLSMVDRVALAVIQAYRIGAKNNPKHKYPWDIIIMLSDMRYGR